jgi:hypothetical protein
MKWPEPILRQAQDDGLYALAPIHKHLSPGRSFKLIISAPSHPELVEGFARRICNYQKRKQHIYSDEASSILGATE